MTIFSDKLHLLRIERNLSQQQLSEALNVSKSRISMYEQGERQPNLEMLVSIANYFNVSTDYLLGRSDGSSATSTLNANESKELKTLINTVKDLDPENIKLLNKVAKAIKRNNKLV